MSGARSRVVRWLPGRGRSEALLMGTGTVWVWRQRSRAQIRRGQVRDISETPVDVLSPQRTSWSSGTWAGGPLDRQTAVKAFTQELPTHSYLELGVCG